MRQKGCLSATPMGVILEILLSWRTTKSLSLESQAFLGYAAHSRRTNFRRESHETLSLPHLIERRASKMADENRNKVSFPQTPHQRSGGTMPDERSLGFLTAAREWDLLPAAPQRRRSTVSLAPYSPPAGGPQTQPRCKRSRLSHRPVGERASSPAAPGYRR